MIDCLYGPSGCPETLLGLAVIDAYRYAYAY